MSKKRVKNICFSAQFIVVKRFYISIGESFRKQNSPFSLETIKSP